MHAVYSWQSALFVSTVRQGQLPTLQPLQRRARAESLDLLGGASSWRHQRSDRCLVVEDALHVRTVYNAVHADKVRGAEQRTGGIQAIAAQRRRLGRASPGHGVATSGVPAVYVDHARICIEAHVHAAADSIRPLVPAVVRSLTRLSPTTRGVTLEVESTGGGGGFAFEPGMWVDMHIPGVAQVGDLMT